MKLLLTFTLILTNLNAKAEPSHISAGMSFETCLDIINDKSLIESGTPIAQKMLTHWDGFSRRFNDGLIYPIQNVSEVAIERIDKEPELNDLAFQWMELFLTIYNMDDHRTWSFEDEMADALHQVLRVIFALADARGRLIHNGELVFPLFSIDPALDPMSEYLRNIMLMLKQGETVPDDINTLETWVLNYTRTMDRGPDQGGKVFMFELSVYASAIGFSGHQIKLANKKLYQTIRLGFLESPDDLERRPKQHPF